MAQNIQIKTNMDAFINATQKPLIPAMDRMAQAVVSGAKMTCPKSDKNLDKKLVKTGRWRGKGLERTIIFGGNGLKNYAHAQEEGTNGIAIFRNYTTPGTGAHYLKNSGDAVAKKGVKAFL